MKDLVSFLLRLAGVGGKFAAMMVLARYASPSEVGLFGLFFAAVNLLVFVIGLDFHLFSVRELVARRSASGKLRVIATQGLLDLVLYSVFALGVFMVQSSPIGPQLPLHLGWLTVIVIADHLSQEFSRLFLILRQPHASNVIYAVKTGLWGWLAAAAIFGGILPARVESFYALWLGCNVLAIIGGALLLSLTLSGARASLPPAIGKVFRRGFAISRYYYATSIALMVVAYVDRFIVADVAGLGQAGLYTFWHSIVSLLPVAVYAMAGMHFLPVLVEAFQRRRIEEFRIGALNFARKTLLISAIFGIGILATFRIVPTILGKPEFEASYLLVALLVGTYAANAAWQVPYQVLYSAQRDRFLAYSLTAISVAIIPLTYVAARFGGIEGAALVGLITNGTILLVLSRQAARELGVGALNVSLIGRLLPRKTTGR